mmetsp:Transcript_22209/g.71451  ORF Transcript_22209/g.71451 Transcript_22209/m.71451 type:complete len:232 (+) Transcript_22209:333-1028(+)
MACRARLPARGTALIASLPHRNCHTSRVSGGPASWSLTSPCWIDCCRWRRGMAWIARSRCLGCLACGRIPSLDSGVCWPMVLTRSSACLAWTLARGPSGTCARWRSCVRSCAPCTTTLRLWEYWSACVCVQMSRQTCGLSRSGWPSCVRQRPDSGTRWPSTILSSWKMRPTMSSTACRTCRWLAKTLISLSGCTSGCGTRVGACCGMSAACPSFPTLSFARHWWKRSCTAG